MSDDDDFFAAYERYWRNRILQGGPQIDQERLRAILDKLRDGTQRGVDLRDAVTLEEFKLVLAASAEWQRLTMPNRSWQGHQPVSGRPVACERSDIIMGRASTHIYVVTNLPSKSVGEEDEQV
jgi:hypothetical protein